MEDKNLEIRINSERDKEIKFSRGFKFLLVIGSVLTSVYAIVLIVLLYSLIGDEKVNIYNVVFVRDIIFSLQMTTCFITFLSILIKKRPFSKIITWCVYLIGIYNIIQSFILPILPNFETNFVLFSFAGSSYYIDGNSFLKGLIIIIFARIIKYGFEYQNRDDETL